MANDGLPVLHFSDVLCVWAYVAQARIDELQEQFGDRVALSFHYISVYGDVPRRIASSGRTPAEYGAINLKVAARYPHITVNPGIFVDTMPQSCVPAHLHLRAVHLLEQRGAVGPIDGRSAMEALAWAFRTAFFRDLRDVSQRAVLDEIVAELDLPVGEIAACLDGGCAHADLARDAQLQQTHKVPMSPSLVLNEGRQLLNGNVGYRVIEANLRELLEHPSRDGSWC